MQWCCFNNLKMCVCDLNSLVISPHSEKKLLFQELAELFAVDDNHRISRDLLTRVCALSTCICYTHHSWQDYELLVHTSYYMLSTLLGLISRLSII